MLRKSIQTLVSVLLLSAGAVLLSGCESARKAVGLEKDAPDEFSVYSRAPLSVPPEYNLRPPEPGTARPQEGDTRDQALSALQSGGATTASPSPTPATNAVLSNASPGLAVLMQQAGADKADPSIRQLVNSETRALAADETKFTETILFWNDSAEYGTVVDPAAETKRIQENQALGKPINEGAVPTIKRKSKDYLFTW